MFQFEVEGLYFVIDHLYNLLETLIDSNPDQVHVLFDQNLPEIAAHGQGQVFKGKSGSFGKLPVDLIVGGSGKLKLKGDVFDSECVKSGTDNPEA